MSKGQLQLLKQILRAGTGTAAASVDQLRESFERFNSKFPSVEGVEIEAVTLESPLRTRNPGTAANPGAAAARSAVRPAELRAEWVDATGEGEAAGHDRAILYLHGGGFVVGSIDSHRQLVARLSRAAHAPCLSLDYRRAPEHPYPAALDDALAALDWLAEHHPDRRFAIAGDSAGGGLAVLAAIRRRQRGASLLDALLCFSPWVDYEGQSASIDRHAALDPVVDRQGLERMAALYLGDADPRDPGVTPLLADPSGLPPMLIQAGGAETLLDDATRLAAHARAHGVDVTLDLWPEMIHGWHLFAGRLEEGRQAIEAAGAWLSERWARPATSP